MGVKIMLLLVAIFCGCVYTAEDKCRIISNNLMSCMNAKEDDLPKTIQGNINWLTISKSTIPTVKKSVLKNFPKITDFHAENNGIEKIEDDAFVQLKALNWVDLSLNKIKAINVNLVKNLQIDHFNLSGNPTLTIPSGKAFLNSDKLKWLDISSCEIKQVYVESFESLPLLRDLSLANNQLNTLPDNIFHKNVNLMSLDITKNKIKMLPAKIFQNLRSLVIVARFEDNPWDCDCKLTPLLNWSRKNVIKGNVICDKPTKGKKWTDIVDPKPCL